MNLEVVGGDVWVPDDHGNAVARIDGATGQVKETIPTGRNPAVVAGVDGDIWGPPSHDSQVWRIHPW